MLVELSAAERAALEERCRQERRVRQWRRSRAIELLARGQAPAAVAAALGCALSSIYNWAAAWRRTGAGGLAEGPHGGRPRALGEPAETCLTRLLSEEPQAHGYQASGWTVPLLRTALERTGHPTSERTVRRMVRRLGYTWQRPKYVLGRPDPDYTAKKGRWQRA